MDRRALFLALLTLAGCHPVVDDDGMGTLDASASDATIVDASPGGFVSDATSEPPPARQTTYVEAGPSDDDAGCALRPVDCECDGGGCASAEETLRGLELTCIESGPNCFCGEIEADFDDAGCAVRFGYLSQVGAPSVACIVASLDAHRWECVPHGGVVTAGLSTCTCGR